MRYKGRRPSSTAHGRWRILQHLLLFNQVLALWETFVRTNAVEQMTAHYTAKTLIICISSFYAYLYTLLSAWQ